MRADGDAQVPGSFPVSQMEVPGGEHDRGEGVELVILHETSVTVTLQKGRDPRGCTETLIVSSSEDVTPL